jgi:hypothetical protein
VTPSGTPDLVCVPGFRENATLGDKSGSVAEEHLRRTSVTVSDPRIRLRHGDVGLFRIAGTPCEDRIRSSNSIYHSINSSLLNCDVFLIVEIRSSQYA